MSQLQGRRVLVVDDERDLRDVLREAMETEGAEVFEAINGVQAFEMIRDNPVDAVVSDVRMPGGSAMVFFKELSKHKIPLPPVILLSGYSDISSDEAASLGALRLMSKPFDLYQLIEILEKAVSSDQRETAP